MSDFYQTLHELAESFAEEEGHDLDYVGELLSNYPWVYVDFEIRGVVPLYALVDLEAKFKKACEDCANGASYLSTHVGGGRVRCRLIYRPDLVKQDSGQDVTATPKSQ